MSASEDALFWDAARSGNVVVQHCSNCDTNQLYPRMYCKTCGGVALSWQRADPIGTLYTYTVVRRAPSEVFRERVPYIVAIVDLDAGPRLMGNLTRGSAEIKIGMRVEVGFDVRQGETPVAVFRPLPSPLYPRNGG